MPDEMRTLFVARKVWIAVSLHWLSDILAGAFVGAATMILLFKPALGLVRRLRIILSFERREYIGYPLLFICTYELANMFGSTRQLVKILFEQTA